MQVVDSHIHCGIQNLLQPFNQIEPLLKEAGISSACLFAPVEDIYDRYSRHFDDNHKWKQCRARAHDYLLEIGHERDGIYPYYFVWNDFMLDDLDNKFFGIKWHHHAGEPSYHYSDPRCAEMIDAICTRKMPIVLEETFKQTLQFIEQVAGRTPIIIPHLGLLNGGYEILSEAGIWLADNVYADTALAGKWSISNFLEKYSSAKLLFGSDDPFGMPGRQLRELKRMGIETKKIEKICAGNILGLLQASKRG